MAFTSYCYYKDANLAIMHHSSNSSTEIQRFIIYLLIYLLIKPVRPRQQAVALHEKWSLLKN